MFFIIINNYFLSQVFQKVILPTSTICVTCKELALKALSWLRRSILQASQSLMIYIWKWLNGKSLTSQIIHAAGDEPPLMIHKDLPVDVFVSHVLPRLSVKDVIRLARTNKESLRLLKNQNVVTKLFGKHWVNHSRIAHVVGSSVGQMTELHLGYTLMQTIDFKLLIQQCRQLKSFSLYGGVDIQSSALTDVADNCHNLTSLYFSQFVLDNSEIILDELNQRCPEVESLALDRVSIAPGQAVTFCQKFPKLTKFYLFNQGIFFGDRFIQHLAQSCPQLTHIYLNNCYNVEDTISRALIQNYPHLTVVHLTNAEVNQIFKQRFEY